MPEIKITANVDEARRALEKFRDEIKQILGSAFKDVGPLIAPAMKELSKALQDVGNTDGLKKISSDLRSLNNSVQKFSGETLKTATDNLRELGDVLRNIPTSINVNVKTSTTGTTPTSPTVNNAEQARLDALELERRRAFIKQVKSLTENQLQEELDRLRKQRQDKIQLLESELQDEARIRQAKKQLGGINQETNAVEGELERRRLTEIQAARKNQATEELRDNTVRLEARRDFAQRVESLTTQQLKTELNLLEKQRQDKLRILEAGLGDELKIRQLRSEVGNINANIKTVTSQLDTRELEKEKAIRDLHRSQDRVAQVKANAQKLEDERAFRQQVKNLTEQQLKNEQTLLQQRIQANKQALNAIVDDERAAARIAEQIARDRNRLGQVQTTIGQVQAGTQDLRGARFSKVLKEEEILQANSLNKITALHQDANNRVVAAAQFASERMKLAFAGGFAAVASGIPVIRELGSIILGFATGGPLGGGIATLVIGFTSLTKVLDLALSGLKSFVEEGIKVSAEFQERQIAIQALLAQNFRFSNDVKENFVKAGEETKKVFDDLLRLVPQSIGGINQLTKAFQQTVATGSSLGVGIDEATKLAPLLVNSISLITGKYNDQRQILCLHGSVKIPLLDGREYPIRSLVGHDDLQVYAYDLEAGKVVPARALCMKMGEKLCYEVVLDNGESIIASYDHPFLNREGVYVATVDLKPGDSLMPFDRALCGDLGNWQTPPLEVKVTSVRYAGMHDVYDLTVEKYKNFALSAGCFTHNTEITALFQGQMRAGSELIRILVLQNPLFKEQFETAQQQGRTYEFLRGQLSGIAEAGKALGGTLTGVKTTLETIGQVFLTKAFQSTFKELIGDGQKLIAILNENQSEINKMAINIDVAARHIITLGKEFFKVLQTITQSRTGIETFQKIVAAMAATVETVAAGLAHTMEGFLLALKAFDSLASGDILAATKQGFASLGKFAEASFDTSLQGAITRFKLNMAQVKVEALQAAKDLEFEVFQRFRKEFRGEGPEARAPRPENIIPKPISIANEAELRAGIAKLNEYLNKLKEFESLKDRIASKNKIFEQVFPLGTEASNAALQTIKNNKELSNLLDELIAKYKELNKTLKIPGKSDLTTGAVDREGIERQLTALEKGLEPFIRKQERLAKSIKDMTVANEELLEALQRRRLIEAELEGRDEGIAIILRTQLQKKLNDAIAEEAAAQEQVETKRRLRKADSAELNEAVAKATQKGKAVAIAEAAVLAEQIREREKALRDEERLEDAKEKARLKILDTDRTIAVEEERIEGDSLRTRFALIERQLGRQRDHLREEIRRILKSAEEATRLGKPTDFVAVDISKISEQLNALAKLEEKLKNISKSELEARDTKEQLKLATTKLDNEISTLHADFDAGRVSISDYRRSLSELKQARIEELNAAIKQLSQTANIISFFVGEIEVVRKLRQEIEELKKAEEREEHTRTPTPAHSIFEVGRRRDAREPLAGDIRNITDEINGVISSIVNAFKQGIAQGIGQILQVVGQMVGGVVGAIISAVGTILSAIGSLFTRGARKLAEQLKKEMQEIIHALNFEDLGLGEAIRRLEAERQRAINDLSRKKGGRKELEKLLPQLDAELDRLRQQQRQIITRFNRDLEVLRLDPNVRSLAESFNTLRDRLKEFIGAGGDAGAAFEFLARSIEDSLRRVNQALDEEEKRFAKTISKLDEQERKTIAQLDKQEKKTLESSEKAINAELKRFLQGAENDIGQLISLEEKALLDIAASEDKFFREREKRTRDIGKLEADIAKSIADEEARINQILAEGVAVRQKSTIQDKLDRIAAVQSDAAARRDEHRQRIADIRQQEQEATIAHSNELLRIQNRLERARQEHEERLTQIKSERDERLAEIAEERKERLEAIAEQRREADEAHLEAVKNFQQQLDFIKQMGEELRKAFFPNGQPITGNVTITGGGPTAEDREIARRQAEYQNQTAAATEAHLEVARRQAELEGKTATASEAHLEVSRAIYDQSKRQIDALNEIARIMTNLAEQARFQVQAIQTKVAQEASINKEVNQREIQVELAALRQAQLEIQPSILTKIPLQGSTTTNNQIVNVAAGAVQIFSQTTDGAEDIGRAVRRELDNLINRNPAY